MHRIGLGSEVYLVPKGKKQVLGGIELPPGKTLKKNNVDEDILARALCSALVGALAISDIETCISESQGRGLKKNQSLTVTLETLREVCKAVWARGYAIANADIVCMGHELSILGLRGQIREGVSVAMNMKRQDVGLKSSQGFFGKETSLFVQAVVLLNKKNDVKKSGKL